MQDFKAAMSSAYGLDALVVCDAQGVIKEVHSCLSTSLEPEEKCVGVKDKCNAQMLFLPVGAAGDPDL